MVPDRRWGAWALGLSLAAACGGPTPTTATVTLGLVPDEVETVSVFVVDGAEVVATATLTPPRVRVALGVPAEVPLTFHAVARSDRPAPPALGGRMPAFVARSVRTIPLGRDVVGVPLDARPGGGLTFAVTGLEDSGERVPLVLESAVEARPRRIVVPVRGGRGSLALPSGRWTIASDDEDWVVLGGAGLWVEPQQESVTFPVLAPALPPPAAGAPARLTLAVLADGVLVPAGGTVTATAALTVEVAAFDDADEPAPTPPAEVFATFGSAPDGLWPAPAAEIAGLPAALGPFAVGGAGRLTFDVEVRLTDGRRLFAAWYGNAGGPGGPPVALAADVARPEDLAVRTEVRLALLDAEGRFAAPVPWTVDLERSASWVFLPDGPVLEADATRVALPVARPSGPRGLPVDLRAVATSTAFVGTLTATVALPLVSEVTP